MNVTIKTRAQLVEAGKAFLSELGELSPNASISDEVFMVLGYNFFLKKEITEPQDSIVLKYIETLIPGLAEKYRWSTSDENLMDPFEMVILPDEEQSDFPTNTIKKIGKFNVIMLLLFKKTWNGGVLLLTKENKKIIGFSIIVDSVEKNLRLMS